MVLTVHNAKIMGSFLAGSKEDHPKIFFSFLTKKDIYKAMKNQSSSPKAT
jgi:hypothetical protein